jgi:molybdopterin biosynthesis enzyme
MISLEEARELVLSRVEPMAVEEVGVLEVIGRVAAEDLESDIDIAPFAHSAMDGFAMRAEQLAGASEETPVELDVIAEVPAGAWYGGAIEDGQCVRIMTGAPLPEAADSSVKYEIVDIVSGDGRQGSRVAFTAPTEVGSQIRQAGEEAKAGEVIVHAGEVVQLNAALLPETSITTYTWLTSKARVAVVDGNGLVTALQKGTAKITVTTSNRKKATVTVKVLDPYAPASVALAEIGPLTLHVGESLTLNPVLTPATAKTTFTWTSSKKARVAVDGSGTITALRKGKVKITVKTANKKRASIVVNVVD